MRTEIQKIKDIENDNSCKYLSLYSFIYTHILYVYTICMYIFVVNNNNRYMNVILGPTINDVGGDKEKGNSYSSTFRQLTDSLFFVCLVFWKPEYVVCLSLDRPL